MKRYFFLSIGLALFTGFSSCRKSFLDVPITRTQIAENYITDLTSAETLLNGAYVKLAMDVYNYDLAVYPDVVSDNTKIDGGRLFDHYSWNQIADNSSELSSNLNDIWMRSYNVIRYCNFILEKIDGFRNENPSKADAIKGQAFALRALLHFNMLNVFAQPYGFSGEAAHPGIPYDTVYAQTELYTREPVRDVYEHVISDLIRAISLIPTSVTSKSNVTLNAAKAFLARVYLFKGDYAKAKDLSVNVTAAVPLMKSADYPAKLFTPNDSESLFWLQPVQTTTGARFPGYIYSIPSSPYYFATSDITGIIKERPLDLRNNWFKDTLSNKMVKKFPVGVVAGFTDARRAQYYTLIRSSEMYLTAAESYSKTGNEDSARYYLDAIRKRADNSVLASSATGPALLDSIYKERRKELCFEGIRMYDLLRLGKGVNRTDVISPAPKVLSYPSDKAIAPIPQQDVDLNSLEQNNGY
jgi:hypothetical protein